MTPLVGRRFYYSIDEINKMFPEKLYSELLQLPSKIEQSSKHSVTLFQQYVRIDREDFIKQMEKLEENFLICQTLFYDAQALIQQFNEYRGYLNEFSISEIPNSVIKDYDGFLKTYNLLMLILKSNAEVFKKLENDTRYLNSLKDWNVSSFSQDILDKEHEKNVKEAEDLFASMVIINPEQEDCGKIVHK